jgi:hypothetical protein
MLFFLSGIAARDVAFSSGETGRGFFSIGRGGVRCNFFVRRRAGRDVAFFVGWA